MKQVISWILTAAIGILCIAPLITLPTVSAAGQNQNGFDFGAYKSGTYKGRFSGGNQRNPSLHRTGKQGLYSLPGTVGEGRL